MTVYDEMRRWWHPTYIEAARNTFADICNNHQLAVGWKMTATDATTRNGTHYWGVVHGDHDIPRFHECDNWNRDNTRSCPSEPGDGLCLIDDSWREASSGGVRLSSCIGHVLVYPADLACGDTPGKWRVPWCIQVDVMDIPALLRSGVCRGADLGDAYLGGADLGGAYLGGADLGGADLRGAYLVGAYLGGADLGFADLRFADLRCADLGFADLRSANLGGANLRSADLRFADLGGANLRGASASTGTLWPAGFDHAKAGVVS